jgi:hypothetical protein
VGFFGRRKPVRAQGGRDMKAANAPLEDIRKMVFDNAVTLFNLPV